MQRVDTRSGAQLIINGRGGAFMSKKLVAFPSLVAGDS